MFVSFQAIPARWPEDSLARLFYTRASSWAGHEIGMKKYRAAISKMSGEHNSHALKVRVEASRRYGSGIQTNAEFLSDEGASGGGASGGASGGTETGHRNQTMESEQQPRDSASPPSPEEMHGGTAPAPVEQRGPAADNLEIGAGGGVNRGTMNMIAPEYGDSRREEDGYTNASYNARGELITGISFDMEYELDDLNSPSWVSISNIQF